MSVTINFTFEKKHFLLLGIIIAIPFLFIAITQIMAVPAGGQYHPLSELFANSNLDMNGMNITNVSIVKATKYCDENGNNCDRSGELNNCVLVTNITLYGWEPGVHDTTASCSETKKVTGGGYKRLIHNP